MIEPIDPRCVRTIPLGIRPNEADTGQLARPPAPGRSFELLASLPRVLAGEGFRAVFEVVDAAHRAEHLFRRGQAPRSLELARP